MTTLAGQPHRAAVMQAGPPVQVRLPSGGWQVGFRTGPDGRTVVEVTDTNGALAGLVASAAVSILSIDAGWAADPTAAPADAAAAPADVAPADAAAELRRDRRRPNPPATASSTPPASVPSHGASPGPAFGAVPPNPVAAPPFGESVLLA